MNQLALLGAAVVNSCLLLLLLQLVHTNDAQLQSTYVVNFTAHPTLNQEVSIGDTVELNCTVEAGEVLRWVFNYDAIEPSNSAYTISGGNLAIGSFQPSLAGSYRCVASRDDGKTQQVSHAGRVAYFAQRRFTVHPNNYTTYEDTPTNWYPEAPFQCTFSAVYYGVRPIITWEVQRNGGGPIQSVPLPNLQAQLAVIDSQSDPLGKFRLGADSVTHRQVIFQRNYTGFFQLHFPDPLSDDGMTVRCVATHPDYNTQFVKSNWATLTIKDGPIPSDTPIFSSHPPSTVSAIEGQDLVLDCTKGIRNVSSSIQWYYDGQESSNIIASQGVESSSVSLPGGSPYGYSNYYINTTSPQYSTYIGNYIYCGITDTNNTVRFMAVQLVPVVVTLPFTPRIEMNNDFSVNTVPIGQTINLFAISVQPNTSIKQWWFRGAVVMNSSDHIVTQDNLFVLHTTIVDGGIYQAEITSTRNDVFEYRPFSVIIAIGTSSHTIHWKELTMIPSLVPPSPTGYAGSPGFSNRLTINSNGDLVSIGQLTYNDNGTYTVISNDYLAQGTLHLSISVSGSEQVNFHWRSPVLAIILPVATEEYSISPSLPQRLHVNTLGLLSSDGQLQYGDAGTYMISSSQFQGALTLMLTVSVEGTLTAALHWMNPSSVSLILPDALHGYTSNPPLSHRLSIDHSGNLMSTGQLQASDAGNVAISSIDYTGTLHLSLQIQINGSREVIVNREDPTTVVILPVSTSGYTVVPALSSRLMVNSTGHFVSTGQLQASDAGTYMITSSDFIGSFKFTLLIFAGKVVEVTLDWMAATTVPLLPTVPSGYTVVQLTSNTDPPALSSRLMVNSSGHLISTGQLQTSDVGVYNVSTSDFLGGDFLVVVCISVSGSVDLVLPWKKASSISLLPTALSGYTVIPALSSRLMVNSSGYLVSTGQLQASDADTYQIRSSDFVGVLSISITINISGVEYITTLWMTPLSVKVLPDGFPKETHSGFNISSSGHLVSNGLDLEDSDTYHFSTAAYDGLLTVTIVVNAPGYVLAPLQDIDTRNGSRVVLQCSANAHPLPVHYVWKKDGVHIANSTDDSLVLTEVSPSDVGVYTCCPSNILGTFNTSSALLNVEIDLSLVWLIPHNVSILSAGSSQYRCITNDKPDNIQTPFQITAQGYFSASSLDLTSSGRYECFSNISNATLTIYLTIIGYEPVQPTISTVTSDSNKLNVSWTDIATPTRPVDVYQLEITTLPRRPTRERQSDAVGSRRVASTNETFLIIEYDSTQEQYIFRLRASNSAGSSEYSGQYQFDTSLLPTLGVGTSDAPSVVVWPIILIIILLLLCCVCCWICIIAIACVHRRKQRKSYPAEEREKKFRDDDERYCTRPSADEESDIIELAPVASSEDSGSNGARSGPGCSNGARSGPGCSNGAQSGPGSSNGAQSGPGSSNDTAAENIKRVPTNTFQTDV